MSNLNEILDDKATEDLAMQRKFLIRRKTTVIEEEYYLEISIPAIESGEGLIAFDKPTFVSKPKTQVNEKLAKNQIDDYRERQELAKIVDINNMPEKRVDAVDQLTGLFDAISNEEEINIVEMVKKQRRRC
jgi:hypothetical protein